MYGAADAPRSPVLDEVSLLAFMNDVWDLPSSPFRALELLDEGEVTMTSLSLAIPKKPKKRRRCDRYRPYHEIARLQAEAEELEHELQEQLTGASKRALCSFNTLAENAELKALVRESVEATRALEQNLNKQVEELVRMMPCSMNLMTRNLPFDTTRDESVFRMMARSVDTQYEEMDCVLRLAGLHGVNSEVMDVDVCRPKKFDALLKSRARILSPFKSGSLVEALWTYIKSSEGAAPLEIQASRKLVRFFFSENWGHVSEIDLCIFNRNYHSERVRVSLFRSTKLWWATTFVLCEWW